MRGPWWCCLWLSSLGGCASSAPPDPDLVRPESGAPFLEEIPGPLLGPFESSSDALLAACGKILSKPHASAGRPDHPSFDTRWRVSSEYCAWLYYTPEHRYVVSRLTDQSRVDPVQRSKSCLLPSRVVDARYPAEALRYIYALHNHPYGSALSANDLRFIVSEGRVHGFESETESGRVRLSIVAFFSNVMEPASCDGFHQYIPLTGQLLKWTRDASGWRCEQTGRVTWQDAEALDFTIQKLQGPCMRGVGP
ncbi:MULTISPECIES: hypothetical protein [Corallococcus]|uniref:hypothetical protein n=1 Tax=Corallococcus TaxID=83461 RepID=UPI001180B206|nr:MULTISPECIES: hypothetical protein [Corallococcus]NBD10565.1 hypothetical protein [Corallococcus silvisoli]TSC27762.1 hypothetical protein FOF48_20420 [Corallococcus sp. Z5C101001]